MTYYSKAGFPIEPLDGELTLKLIREKAYEIARNRAAYSDDLWVPRQCVDVRLAPDLYSSIVRELREMFLPLQSRVCVIGDFIRVNLDGVSIAFFPGAPPGICAMPFYSDIEAGYVVTPACHWCWTGCRAPYVGDYAI